MTFMSWVAPMNFFLEVMAFAIPIAGVIIGAAFVLYLRDLFSNSKGSPYGRL